MSLIQTWHHGPTFGIVCSDGRVSTRWTDGHHSVVPGKTVRKFIVLRASPGLVLAGSSSISRWLDFSVCDAVRRYVEDFPEAGFDQVARIVGPTVYEARADFFCNSKSQAFFDGTDGSFLNLLGYDGRCVRNRVFSCTERCTESEVSSGAMISGFSDAEEAGVMAGKLLELVGRERTPERIVESMLTIGEELSESHPETIGPPYSFHLVTNRMAFGRATIEEQFRRALASTLPLGAPQTGPGACLSEVPLPPHHP